MIDKERTARALAFHASRKNPAGEKQSTSATPAKARSDREPPPPDAPFAHLRDRGHLLAAFATRPNPTISAKTAPAPPHLASTPEAESQATADFILRAGAKARGTLEIPREAPKTAEDQRAQANADRMLAVLREVRPSMLRETK